jgi:steroid delta-isomerase-like uncharacterized protein
MSQKNKDLVVRWFEQVWNQQNEAAVDVMFHPEGKLYGFPGAESAVEGPEAFKVLRRNFLSAFPNVRVDIEEVIAEGDRVAIRWTATMTHLGDGLGFPATGKAGRLEGSSFCVMKDGMIFEGWNQMDFQGLICNLQAQLQQTSEPATESAVAVPAD